MAIDLTDLMKLYARRGIQDWNASRPQVRQQASAVLKNKIATNEWEAFRTINANLKGGADERCMFIPMPTVNHGGIQSCFFIPIRVPGNGGTAFDLLLLVDDENGLGFRFEPADPPTMSHSYGHVQMNRMMFRRSIEVASIPRWLPDSYPAFPIRSSDPLHLFLMMATSVHGYGDGMIRVLKEVFVNRPIDTARYLETLKECLT